jgi:flagellar basal-body rod protein FlgG
MIRSLRTAATGMESQQLRVDVIANNLANVNTVGFKRSRAEFQDLFYQEIRAARRGENGQNQGSPNPLEVGQGSQPVATQKIFETGSMMETGNQMDLAIEGRGFFRVLLPNGEPVYTRAGTFKINSDGQMVTSSNHPMDPPITIPDNTVNLIVERDGTVKVQQPSNTGEMNEIGQMELTQFVNPSGLKSLGQGLYQETEASGIPLDGAPGEDGLGWVTQGFLEASNVVVVEEMISLISAQRAYEINSRVIKASDEMLSETARLR